MTIVFSYFIIMLACPAVQHFGRVQAIYDCGSKYAKQCLYLCQRLIQR
jgi:hypothetical protein